jgi:hypothetical protein
MLYDFENIKTGEVKEYSMRLADYDEFVKNNPHLKRVMLKAPQTISGTGSVVSKTDDGWKEVQQKIKRGLPPSLRDNIREK